MATEATVLPADKFDTSTTFVRPENAPVRAPLDRLQVLPGFNTRVKDADYRDRVEGIAESIIANGFFEDKPFAVTMLPGDETIYIFDGEHRFDAAKRASLDTEFPEGLPIAWARDGATVKDLTVHLAHGNNGERLGMVELAAVVRRMQALQMDKAEIATALGRTTRHVENLFVLAEASNAVKKAVASGQIAGAEAVKLLRKDPKTAGAKITEAVAAAEAKGKAKATPKTMKDPNAPLPPKTKTLPFTINAPIGMALGDVLKGMAQEIRSVVKFAADTDLVEGEAMIRFSVTVRDHEAEATAEQARIEKAEKAEQAAKDKAAKAEQAAKDKEARLAAREESMRKTTADREAAAADKQAKKEAEQQALKEAAAKATETTGKVSAAEAKRRAAAHLGGGKEGKATPKAKAPAKGKTGKAAQKPAESKKPSAATPAASVAESAPAGGENPAPMSDESMGGL